jgi:ribokinase
VQGETIDEAPGGKGANQAVAVARLGARAVFIGRIGEDERGDRLLNAFGLEEVDATHILRDANACTGVALIHVDRTGQKQILAVPGANSCVTADDVERSAPIIREAAILMLQLEIPFDAVRAAARIAHEAGVKVLVDPAPPRGALPGDLLKMINVIKPNAAEVRALTGVEVNNPVTAREAAKKLLAAGVGCVAVTAGSEGTLVVWNDDESWLPRLPVKSVDATGAGDAFAAGFAFALAEGKSFADAGIFANAAAALATTVVGAQAAMPTRDAIVELLRRIKG